MPPRSAETETNWGPEECVQCAISVLRRTEGETIISPRTRRLIDPAVERNRDMLWSCRLNRTLLEQARELIDMALAELDNAYNYSPWARSVDYRSTIPNAPDELIVRMNDNIRSITGVSLSHRARSAIAGVVGVVRDLGHRTHQEARRRTSHAMNMLYSRFYPAPILRSVEEGSNSLTEDEKKNMIDFCASKFANIPAGMSHEGLKPFINKLKRICNAVYNRKFCRVHHLTDVLNRIHSMYTEQGHQRYIEMPADTPDENFHVNMCFTRYISNHGIFKRASIEYFEIKTERTLDDGGVRTQFFQLAGNQLRDFGIFKETEDGTDVFTFNEAYDGPNRLQKCTFAGSLLAFLMVNKIRVDFHLSKAILMHLLMPPEKFDDDYYAMFFLLEYPTSGIGLVNLMEIPEKIENVGFTFNNDEHKLDRSKTYKKNNVTADNYREYVGKFAKHMLIGGAENMLEAFKQGFWVSLEWLASAKLTISQLDALITATEVTEEQRYRIAHSLEQKLEASYHRDNDKVIKVIKWLIEIIRHGDTFYPIEAVAGEEHLPQDFKTFMKMLCFFWTGSAAYNSSFAYTFEPYGGDHFAGHTCAHIIQVPLHFKSIDEMFRQLVRSVTDTGFWLV